MAGAAHQKLKNSMCIGWGAICSLTRKYSSPPGEQRAGRGVWLEGCELYDLGFSYLLEDINMRVIWADFSIRKINLTAVWKEGGRKTGWDQEDKVGSCQKGSREMSAWIVAENMGMGGGESVSGKSITWF